MQENISNYIGIPFEFAGYSFTGADCVGLVRLFYQEHKWKPTCYDGEFSKDWYKKEPYKIIRYLLKHFEPIKNSSKLQYGDVVYFTINGEGHVGIYIRYGKLLTTFPPDSKQWNGSIMPDKSFLIHKQMWIPAFKAGFRRRGA